MREERLLKNNHKKVIIYVCVAYKGDINYNLLINTRVINKRTNLAKIYLENTYIVITSNIKANVIWFIK